MNSLILTLISWTSCKRNKNHLGMRNSFEQELPCLKRILSIHCYHCFTWTLCINKTADKSVLLFTKTFLNLFFLTFEKYSPTKILNHAPHKSTLGVPRMLATYKDHLQPPLTPQGPLLSPLCGNRCTWLAPNRFRFTRWTHNLSTAGARMALPLQKTY